MSLLDVSTIGFQIVLPLALIGWLAFAPPRSGIGLVIQAISTGLVLVALLLAAVWTTLPWWLPCAYIVIWLTAVLFQSFVHDHSNAWLPKGGWTWSALAGLTALSIWTGSVAVSALGGSNPTPGVRVVDLVFPLPPGQYYIANGGASLAINAHMFTLNPQTERQRAYRGQSYAVDIVELGPLGRSAAGWRPADPAVYTIFGKPVNAPCSGTVIAAMDGKPDMPVPEIDTSLLEGNHVVLQCGDFAVLLAHLRRGSLTVDTGDRVGIGDLVGQVGNSGQTMEPHLHIHVQSVPKNGPILSGTPYFLSFDGVFPTRNERFDTRVL